MLHWSSPYAAAPLRTAGLSVGRLRRSIVAAAAAAAAAASAAAADSFGSNVDGGSSRGSTQDGYSSDGDLHGMVEYGPADSTGACVGSRSDAPCNGQPHLVDAVALSVAAHPTACAASPTPFTPTADRLRDVRHSAAAVANGASPASSPVLPPVSSPLEEDGADYAAAPHTPPPSVHHNPLFRASPTKHRHPGSPSHHFSHTHLLHLDLHRPHLTALMTPNGLFRHRRHHSLHLHHHHHHRSGLQQLVRHLPGRPHPEHHLLGGGASGLVLTTRRTLPALLSRVAQLGLPPPAAIVTSAGSMVRTRPWRHTCALLALLNTLAFAF